MRLVTTSGGGRQPVGPNDREAPAHPDGRETLACVRRPQETSPKYGGGWGGFDDMSYRTAIGLCALRAEIGAEVLGRFWLAEEVAPGLGASRSQWLCLWGRDRGR